MALVTSVAALGFTMYSFWWMNWRPGHLSVGNLAQFAAGKATEASDRPNVVIVTLPLVMHNSGACPVVIESLRLAGAHKSQIGTLAFEAVDSHLPAPFADVQCERDYFFLPIALRANEVLKMNFVFERRDSQFDFAHILYHLHLEAKFSGQRGWVKIKDIELDLRDEERTPLFDLNAGYRVYEYAPSRHT